MSYNKSIIPNSITLTNAACGTTAILLSDLEKGIILVSIAMILDVLDGFLAKKIDASSDLGKELDSLADAISFGIAPAFLFYQYFHNQLALLFAIIYTINAIFRLAKYNITPPSTTFNGLPSPAAAGVVLSLLLIDKEIHSEFPTIFLIIFPAVLMNMNISFFSLKDIKNNIKLVALIAMFTIGAGVINVVYAPLMLFSSYILISIVKGINIEDDEL
jgi:CDP-diacylglycerol--serine O-phosphatidyltransferase